MLLLWCCRVRTVAAVVAVFVVAGVVAVVFFVFWFFVFEATAIKDHSMTHGRAISRGMHAQAQSLEGKILRDSKQQTTPPICPFCKKKEKGQA